MGFGYDPNILYITAYHNDLKALYSVDLSEPELTKTLVHADPNFDVGGDLIYDRKGQRVLGIGGSYDGGTLFFDNEFKALQTRIDTADRKSTRLNSSHVAISYAVFCLQKKNPPTDSS